MKIGNAFKKIFDRRGASLFIALLVFFLAALSGTVALTMAASNAGRYTHETENQQSYLSVASAANLIVKTLDGFSVYFRTEDFEAPTKGNTNKVNITYKRNNNNFGDAENELFFGDQRFKDALYARSLGGTPDNPEISFSLSVASAPEMGNVYVTLDMSSATFIFRLWSQRGSSKDYRMSISIDTTFDPDGSDYTGQPGNGAVEYWDKTMSFGSATFLVENNVPSTEGVNP